MTRYKLFLAAALGLTAAGLLSACVEPLPLEAARAPLPAPPPPPPPPVQAPPGAPEAFRAADFAWSTAPGPDRISGHLGYGLGGYTCAGANVALTPETAWVRQRMLNLYGATSGAALPSAQVRSRTPAASENYSQFVRLAKCDPQSRFVFDGLPNGAWYVITVAHPISGKGDEMAIMRRVETFQGAIALEL